MGSRVEEVEQPKFRSQCADFASGESLAPRYPTINAGPFLTAAKASYRNWLIYNPDSKADQHLCVVYGLC